jgi:hypothetical protein
MEFRLWKWPYFRCFDELNTMHIAVHLFMVGAELHMVAPSGTPEAQ